MSYLPDTNFFIHLQRRLEPLRGRYLVALQAETLFFLSSIVLYELELAVAKSARIEANRERLTTLLGNDFAFLPFDREDARAAARVRSVLESRKQPIGPYDTLIAGQALARGLTLVTSNVREFARVDGLRFEDWGQE